MRTRNRRFLRTNGCAGAHRVVDADHDCGGHRTFRSRAIDVVHIHTGIRNERQDRRKAAGRVPDRNEQHLLLGHLVMVRHEGAGRSDRIVHDQMEPTTRLERERDDVDVFVGEETTNPGERAEAVKRYLYEQHQIPLFKINVISYGEENPVAENNTKAGRAQNRRVVIRVLV